VSEEERKARPKEEAKEVAGILAVVSEQVPALIKSLMAGVFSEEAGRSMGRAAAAYYRELKAGGIPDDEALKLTKDYIGMFTNIGELIKGASIPKPKTEE